ncbi:MAG: hypothetical protein RLZZ453_1137 [Chlamydiota bacterium]|jgi:outer membrane protein assembly factor BamD (BamD/ComL family)
MKPFFYLVVACCLSFSLEAAYLFKNGKLTKTEEVATLSVQEHYALAMIAYEEKDWDELVHQSVILIKNFESTPFALEAHYYLGAAYFHLEEFEYSNRFLTKYLKKQATPKFFEEAITYKFQIAEQFRKGARKHLFGFETLPKWLPAREDAISIYDEVITALPHHDLAAYALFGKAQLLLQDEEYKSSIETYQVLIRRFPKHPLAIEAYIGVSEVYLIQSQQAYPDQDFLDLAEINLRKFRADFPSEQKVIIAEDLFLKMKEVYASDLYDIGRFYERTKKPQAAQIYYTRIQMKYPETEVAVLAKKRADHLQPLMLPTPSLATPPAEELLRSPLLELQPNDLTVQTEESSAPHESSP